MSFSRGPAVKKIRERVEKPYLLIKGWYIYDGYIHGRVYGHPEIEDGAHFKSSKIIDTERDYRSYAQGDVVETYASRIKLGHRYERI